MSTAPRDGIISSADTRRSVGTTAINSTPEWARQYAAQLWACLAPGEPELAARLSREDSCTDHYADGMEACVFLSVVESAAFLEERSDDETAGRLISIGLSYIPESGRLASGIRYAIECVTDGAETRMPPEERVPEEI